MADISELEAILGHTFKEPHLLERALTHPSYLSEHPEVERSYQRLEFLGDAVLGLTLAEELFNLFPDEREGVLAQARSSLAKGSFLVRVAKRIDLQNYLRLGTSEEESGGRSRASTLEDSLEAVFGAVYLDAGFAAARACILRVYGDIREAAERALSRDNPKGKLQEWVQARDPNQPPVYTLVEESGPPHDKRFTVEVEVFGKVTGEGSGRSKKEAEENAARAALTIVT